MAAPTEKQIRDAIVAVVESADATLIVHDHFRTVKGGMSESDFNVFHTNDEKHINVCFVRRVLFSDETTSFDNYSAANETYALFFYRGVSDAEDGEDSENSFQLMLEAVRAKFRLEANKHLGLDNGISQPGLRTLEGLVNTPELGGYSCHRFVAGLSVWIGDC